MKRVGSVCVCVEFHVSTGLENMLCAAECRLERLLQQNSFWFYTLQHGVGGETYVLIHLQCSTAKLRYLQVR